MRFSAPHFRHLLSIRVSPCLTVRVLRSNASFTKRSDSSRISCFDISRFLAFKANLTPYFWKFGPRAKHCLIANPRVRRRKCSVFGLLNPVENKLLAASTMTVLLTVPSRAFSIQQTRGRRSDQVCRSGVEFLGVVGVACLECDEPAAEAGELIGRQLGDNFGDFFDFHVAQYSTAGAWLSRGRINLRPPMSASGQKQTL